MKESQIIENILDGDIDAFAFLIDKYRGKIRAVISKRIPFQEIDSLVQDVFVKAYQGLSGFKKDLPFENWIVTIAMRVCCDYWRASGRSKIADNVHPSIEDDHNTWIEQAGHSKSIEEFEKSVSIQETREVLEIVINKLSPEDKTLIDLVYYEGWKLKDVAKVLDWKLSKVKVRAMRAKEKMRKHISEYLNNE